ncbi:MAG TPA: SusE domain-containing protein [Puia sp.]|nr:SusE domain-containing protein [Puia sp.]
MKKKILNFSFIVGMGAIGMVACEKKMTNQFFADGSTPTMKVSTTTLAPAPADSTTDVLAISWTNPHYATDSATELYTIQIDSSGRNFSKAVSIQISGALSDSLTAKQINTIALDFGFSYNVAYNMDIRVISSYANYNEEYTSNTITISYTPYVIPPKVVPPTGGLYLVGSATNGGWNNPVPVPTQVFEEIDSVDYAGVFELSAGGQFLVLPVNGDWTNKFATADNTESGSGGTFAYNASNNFTGPATAGWYTIWLNFQTGNFTITPAADSVPDSLFLVGNATAGGWNNPVPEPSQTFTQINSSQFSISVPLSASGQFLFLPVNGSWTNKYATSDGSETGMGGTFAYDAANNFTGPANAGTYTILVDFVTDKFSLSQ